MRAVDMSGLRMGRLIVIERAGSARNKGGAATWRCRCDCGIVIVREGGDLRKNASRVQSCGCAIAESARAAATTHGMTGTRTWRSWEAMVQRCTRHKDPSWNRYGGAGIRVCERWLGKEGFAHFFTDMGERPADTTLDRFPDCKGNYEPGNCRWATMTEQLNNQARNRRIEHQGRTMTVAQWSRDVGMGETTILRRLKAGWSPHDALTLPPDKRRRVAATALT